MVAEVQDLRSQQRLSDEGQPPVDFKSSQNRVVQS